MIKQIERQIRDLQRELSEVRQEWDKVRLHPCSGDTEIRQKDESLDGLNKRVEALQERIRGLEKKRREIMSVSLKKVNYESPFT